MKKYIQFHGIIVLQFDRSKPGHNSLQLQSAPQNVKKIEVQNEIERWIKSYHRTDPFCSFRSDM